MNCQILIGVKSNGKKHPEIVISNESSDINFQPATVGVFCQKLDHSTFLKYYKAVKHHHGKSKTVTKHHNMRTNYYQDHLIWEIGNQGEITNFYKDVQEFRIPELENSENPVQITNYKKVIVNQPVPFELDHQERKHNFIFRSLEWSAFFEIYIDLETDIDKQTLLKYFLNPESNPSLSKFVKYYQIRFETTPDHCEKVLELIIKLNEK